MAEREHPLRVLFFDSADCGAGHERKNTSIFEHIQFVRIAYCDVLLFQHVVFKYGFFH